MNILKENDTIFITDIQQPNNKSNKSRTELFEAELIEILSKNNMKVNEFISFENYIKIEIVNLSKIDNCMSDITIILDKETQMKSSKQEELIISDVQINCENHDDIFFLNKIISEIF